MADSLFIVHFAGKALTFIKEKVLTWESGMRRGVPKVLVVVTDGRSQDEVRKAATVIQHSGKQFTVLAVSFLYVLSNAIISSISSINSESFTHHLWTQKCVLSIWENLKTI